jgi:CRISPR-associated protein Cmr4
MSTNGSLYTQQRYCFMALDPIHIGAGGYRLGRADMTIAREPGTNLPKIPGTSLAGAARSYAAMRYGKLEAAGRQHMKLTVKSRAKCPIVYTFGTTTDTSDTGGALEGPTQAGTVSISDARILFFPVNSMLGPVWVSTVEGVREAWGESSVAGDSQPDSDRVTTTLDREGDLNLGWLLFKTMPGAVVTAPDMVADRPEWKGIKQRLVFVDTRLFSQLVNNNLEIRTSVSIDPQTGAAEQGALFTYEAIPRATWLWSDVIKDDYRRNRNGTSQVFPVTKQCHIVKIEKEQGGDKNKEQYEYTDNAGEPLGETWNGPLDVVKAGMGLIEYLGVGGMGTRGFGRMRCVAEWKIPAGGIK